MAAVAEGKFDGMITLRPTWEWDVAAGVLMVEEAGGVVCDRTGNVVQFNNPRPQSKGLIATQKHCAINSLKSWIVVRF